MEGARPPEPFTAKTIGAKTRGAKRLRVLVTLNRRTERNAVPPRTLGGPCAIEHRPPHRQVDGVTMVGVAPVVEEPVNRQRIRGAIAKRVRNLDVKSGPRFELPSSSGWHEHVPA